MNIALILAGGAGVRAGGSLPKQFQRVGGKPMYQWSLDAFREFDPDCMIVITVPSSYIEGIQAELLHAGYKADVVSGGSTRIESVKHGLAYISELLKNDLDLLRKAEMGEVKIFVHDGARPMITPEVISRGYSAAKHGIGAIPVVGVADTIREVSADGTSSETLKRDRLRAVQTPQVFLFEDITRAYSLADTDAILTDDASVAENAGLKICLYDGAPSNIKVTTPVDFKIAEVLLKR